tara:strand:+ start:43 stop:1587 length:1545 start_codon:yes stop_codon:yes gene_type:complete
MKKLYLIVLFFTSFYGSLTCQTNLNGYKYVHVPILEYRGGQDFWGISSKVINVLQDKGFVVITGDLNKSQHYLLISENPCQYLRCEINHTNVSTGVNNVTVKLKNCKEKYVYSEKAGAMGMTLQDDFRKATNRAINKLKYMTYQFNSDYSPKFNYPYVEQTNENEDSFVKYLDNNTANDIEGIYKYIKSSSSANHYKIGIKKYSYKYKGIILESSSSIWKVGEVKFILEPSAVKSMFSCKYFMGNKLEIETFASMPNIAMLEVTIPNGNSNENIKSSFLKLYPSNVVSSNNNPSEGSYNQNDKNWKGNGSGIIISTNGYIVTNNHVVDKMSEFEVEFKRGQEIKSFHAKVVKTDPTNDLAILMIDDDNFINFKSVPYNFKTRSADIGSEVYALGYPKALTLMGKDIKFTDGRISSKTGFKGDITSYQTTTPIQPGNSGGPLFDHNGNLLGINSAKIVSDDVEGVSYTIKASYLLNLIDVLPESIPIPNSTWVGTKPLTEQIKILSNYVVLIKVR